MLSNILNLHLIPYRLLGTIHFWAPYFQLTLPGNEFELPYAAKPHYFIGPYYLSPELKNNGFENNYLVNKL